jgi:hypothetical protein
MAEENKDAENPFGKGMANMPNIEVLTRYNPTNVVSGVGSGTGNVVGGALFGVGKYAYLITRYFISSVLNRSLEMIFQLLQWLYQ